MSTVTIQNQAMDGAGRPIPFAVVRITLVASTTGNAPGYTNGTSIGPPATLKADKTGHWSVALTPNSALLPSGTWYAVSEGGYNSVIVVPPSGGPYNLEQVVTDIVGPTGSTGQAYTDSAVAAEASARSGADVAEAGARAAGDATTLSSAHTYADGAVAAEASVRVAGDAASVTTARGYTDTSVAAEATIRAALDATEASARASGDSATLSAAETYAVGVAAGLALTLGG